MTKQQKIESNKDFIRSVAKDYNLSLTPDTIDQIEKYIRNVDDEDYLYAMKREFSYLSSGTRV